jgi:hypothetical protein
MYNKSSYDKIENSFILFSFKIKEWQRIMDGEEDVSFCSVQYSSTRIRVRVRVRVFILFNLKA